MIEALELMLCICAGLGLAYLAVAFAMGIAIGIILAIKTAKTLWYDWMTKLRTIKMFKGCENLCGSGFL